MATKQLIIFSVFLCLFCSNISTSEAAPEVDETHAVVLKQFSFSEFVEKNRLVNVEFCVPLKDRCEVLTPDYAVALPLSMVDDTEWAELEQKFDVPTISFFVNGVHMPYPGERNKDAIAVWSKRRIRSKLDKITTEDTESRLAKEENLVGSDSEEPSAAPHLEDDVSFYQTTSADMARLSHIDPSVKRLRVVIIKNEPEELTYFDRTAATTDFVFGYKRPLVINFTSGTEVMFKNREKTYGIKHLYKPFPEENKVNKQLILITTPKDTEKAYAIFQEVAKAFQGKLIFVHMESNMTSTNNNFAPTVLAYKGNVDNPMCIMNADFTINNIKSFAEKFLANERKLPLFGVNDGIKEVFGDNFDEIVLDESKDVLLKVYDPWCRRCKNINVIYKDLAMNLRGINSVVIARMDVTFGQHPRAKYKAKDEKPTILFFPAGQKSVDPITFEDDTTSANLYKFVKKHASIPFELIEWDVKDEL